MSSQKTENTSSARIKVVGVGGAGTNAIQRMTESNSTDVEVMVLNTDVQDLRKVNIEEALQIGESVTRGLGTGGDPEIGRQAAEESRQEIKKHLEGVDLVFITAGMGGGTGTGAAPIVAEISRELGALTVAVVTRPFSWEGPKRLRIAEQGILALKDRVDTLITIPNDRLVDVANKNTTFEEAFKIADEVLRQGVQGISDIIKVPGLINVDFADVKAILSDAGPALMGIGKASGEGRASAAAQAAISSPLLESSIDGAERILLNITAGHDLTLTEVLEAAHIVTTTSNNENLNLIFGTAIDDNLQGEIQITVIATGFERRPIREAHRLPRTEELSGEKEKKEPENGLREEDHPRGRIQEDLDVPAFLRRTRHIG